jgi:hypothetical protein
MQFISISSFKWCILSIHRDKIVAPLLIENSRHTTNLLCVNMEVDIYLTHQTMINK